MAEAARIKDDWSVHGSQQEAAVLTTLLTQGPERLPVFEQVLVVAAIVQRSESFAAAAVYLRRSPGWLSKHVRLRQCSLEHLPWTFMVMRDALCGDIEIVYALLQIELIDPTVASNLYARMRRAELDRRSGAQNSRTQNVSRSEIRALCRQVKGQDTRLPRQQSARPLVRPIDAIVSVAR